MNGWPTVSGDREVTDKRRGDEEGRKGGRDRFIIVGKGGQDTIPTCNNLRRQDDDDDDDDDVGNVQHRLSVAVGEHHYLRGG